MAYATLAELRTQVQLGTTDQSQDSQLTIALDAATETIDSYCNRSFAVADPVAPAQSRTYLTRSARRVLIHDLASLDQVEFATGPDTYELVEAGTVLAWPEHADVEGRPFTELRRVTGGSWSEGRRVRVTGRFGWPAVPAVVKHATLLQASRFYQRRSAQFGVAPVPGLDGTGMRLLSKLDADVELMLNAVRRDPTRCP